MTPGEVDSSGGQCVLAGKHWYEYLNGSSRGEGWAGEAAGRGDLKTSGVDAMPTGPSTLDALSSYLGHSWRPTAGPLEGIQGRITWVLLKTLSKQNIFRFSVAKKPSYLRGKTAHNNVLG